VDSVKTGFIDNRIVQEKRYTRNLMDWHTVNFGDLWHFNLNNREAERSKRHKGIQPNLNSRRYSHAAFLALAKEPDQTWSDTDQEWNQFLTVCLIFDQGLTTSAWIRLNPCLISTWSVWSILIKLGYVACALFALLDDKRKKAEEIGEEVKPKRKKTQPLKLTVGQRCHNSTKFCTA